MFNSVHICCNVINKESEIILGAQSSSWPRFTSQNHRKDFSLICFEEETTSSNIVWQTLKCRSCPHRTCHFKKTWTNKTLSIDRNSNRRGRRPGAPNLNNRRVIWLVCWIRYCLHCFDTSAFSQRGCKGNSEVIHSQSELASIVRYTLECIIKLHAFN